MRSTSIPLLALLALLPRLSEALFFTSPSADTTWASAAGETLTWSHQRGDPTVGTILLQAAGTGSTVVVASNVDLLAESFAFPSGVALRSNSQTYRLLIVNSADIAYVYTQVGPFAISSFGTTPVATKSKSEGSVVSSPAASSSSSSSSSSSPSSRTSSSTSISSSRTHAATTTAAPSTTSTMPDEIVTSTADAVTVTSVPGEGTSDVVVVETRTASGTASALPTIGSSGSGTSGSWKLESQWTGVMVLAAAVGSLLV